MFNIHGHVASTSSHRHLRQILHGWKKTVLRMRLKDPTREKRVMTIFTNCWKNFPGEAKAFQGKVLKTNRQRIRCGQQDFFLHLSKTSPSIEQLVPMVDRSVTAACCSVESNTFPSSWIYSIVVYQLEPANNFASELEVEDTH